MPESKVVALHIKPSEGGVVSQETLQAVSGKGILGDKCFGRPQRQVLLVSTKHLKEFSYEPGTLREQITTNMPDLQDLTPGTKLQVGAVVIEVTQDCAPCSKMASYLNEDPAAFKKRLAGKRGILGRIVEGGELRLGDTIQVTSG